ncbi:MAG TPA: DUF4397 domain-containing protein [Chthonomonadaceae bacterium]|nr:DUF4397 domain-containing protein [Chthonomonadaceae bacterium]
MKSRKHVLLAGLGLIGALALALTGCGGNNSIGPSGNATSNVRFFNALAGINSVTITQRNPSATPLVSKINYGQTTGYFLAPAGNNIQTYALQPGTQTVLASGGVTMYTHNTGTNVGTSTIIPAGVVGQNSPYNPQVFQFQDAWPSQSAIPANQVAIRFINVAPGSPALTLNNSVSGNLTQLTGLTAITYGHSSTATAYVDEPSGPYNFVVTDTAGHILGSQSVTLSTGTAYTVIVYGTYPPASGSQLSLYVLTDTNNL